MKNLLIVACCVAMLCPAVFAQEVEPNDSKNLADGISGYMICGNLGHSGDVDWFVLTGQEGYSPTFTIIHDHDNDFDFEIFSDNSSVGSGMGVSSGDSASCTVPGTCYVKVWSCSGAGRYQIVISQ